MVANANWNYKEFMNTINEVRERAKTDGDFRSTCLSHPQRAIEEIAGHEFDYYDIIFVDNIEESKLYIDAARTLAFVLPDAEI